MSDESQVPEASAAPAAEPSAKQPELHPDAMRDALGRYPIDLITEEALKPATIAECEAILSAMNQMSGTLRAKAHLVHASMEAKQTERDAIRKSGRMTEADKEALKAHWAAEEAIKADPNLSEEEKAAALAKLNHVEEKPPTQHLQGSFITKDNDTVNPGS